MTNRNICFISPEYWPLAGGTGAYVYYLSNELMKNGYNATIVTGSNQNLERQVNSQLKVYFQKIPKIPIVKSFMLAGASYRKLNSIKSTTNNRHHPPPTALDSQLCRATQFWKNPCLHRPLYMERRSRSHKRRTLQPPKR